MAKNFTDTQLKYVAHGIASGMDPEHIQESAGLTKHMYDKLQARTDVDEHQLTIYDAYLARASSRAALVMIRHQTRCEDMVEPSYRAIQHAIEDFQSNADLAVRTAKWLLQQSAGAPLVEETAPANQANTQINFYTQEKSAKVIEGFIDSVAKTTTELMTTPLPHINEPSRHVSVSEAEVVTPHPSGDEVDPLNEAGE